MPKTVTHLVKEQDSCEHLQTQLLSKKRDNIFLILQKQQYAELFRVRESSFLRIFFWGGCELRKAAFSNLKEF